MTLSLTQNRCHFYRVYGWHTIVLPKKPREFDAFSWKCVFYMFTHLNLATIMFLVRSRYLFSLVLFFPLSVTNNQQACLFTSQVCHSKSGDINPQKIQQLVEGYVNKFQNRHERTGKKDKSTKTLTKEKLKANGERSKSSRWCRPKCVTSDTEKQRLMIHNHMWRLEMWFIDCMVMTQCMS